MSLRLEKANGITTVILNRPEARNAIDPQTAHSLTQAFSEFDQDPNSNVAVLWGDHGHFCAGADLKAIAAGESTTAFNFNFSPTGPGPLGPTRMLLGKPVIAAIAGYAVAGGLELALWCDLRVMEANATLGIFCRRFGVPLIDGGSIRLARLIGQSRALDLILSGRAVQAEEALHIGLVNRVVAPGQSRVAAEELAAKIAAFPQNCLRHDRLSLYEQWNLSMSEALLNEYQHGREVLESGETLQGAKNFQQGSGRHGQF